VPTIGEVMRIIYLLGLIAGIFLASFGAQSIFNAVGISIDLMAASGAGQIINYAIVLICAYLFVTLVWRQSVTGFIVLYFQNWRKARSGFWVCAGLAVIVGLLWYMFVFAAGGAREDFARMYALTDAAARNVRFSGAFLCKAAEPLLGVVTSPAKTYASFPISCP
jgi:hypothetical protein